MEGVWWWSGLKQFWADSKKNSIFSFIEAERPRIKNSEIISSVFVALNCVSNMHYGPLKRILKNPRCKIKGSRNNERTREHKMLHYFKMNLFSQLQLLWEVVSPWQLVLWKSRKSKYQMWRALHISKRLMWKCLKHYSISDSGDEETK